MLLNYKMVLGWHNVVSLTVCWVKICIFLVMFVDDENSSYSRENQNRSWLIFPITKNRPDICLFKGWFLFVPIMDGFDFKIAIIRRNSMILLQDVQVSINQIKLIRTQSRPAQRYDLVLKETA
jgi:hypothetical protein